MKRAAIADTGSYKVLSLNAFEPQAGRYSIKVNQENRRTLQPGVGLCADCRYMRRVESDRGSTFFLCERSATDPAFPKYPRLPVLQCGGYEPLSTDQELAQN